MKMLLAEFDNLVEHFGEPTINCPGSCSWSVNHNGNWIEVSSVPGRLTLFKVESVFGTFTNCINEEIAFMKWFCTLQV